MGGDQIDQRPFVVAYVCSQSRPRAWSKASPDGARLWEYLSAQMLMAEHHHNALVLDTARMFVAALDCNFVTALSAAYTMHVQANWRPI